MTKDNHLTIRISSEDLNEIKQYALKSGRSFTDFVLTAIKQEMGKQDGYDFRIKRLENLLLNK